MTHVSMNSSISSQGSQEGAEQTRAELPKADNFKKFQSEQFAEAGTEPISSSC